MENKKKPKIVTTIAIEAIRLGLPILILPAQYQWAFVLFHSFVFIAYGIFGDKPKPDFMNIRICDKLSPDFLTLIRKLKPNVSIKMVDDPNVFCTDGSTIYISASSIRKSAQVNVEVVLLHEMGHIILNHLFWTRLVACIAKMAPVYVFWFTQNLPLFVLSLAIGFVVQTLHNWKNELEADSYAASLSNSQLVKSALEYVVEVEGAKTGYSFTHPSINYRKNQLDKV
jgi:Zn-dependent protease with chaperone function